MISNNTTKNTTLRVTRGDTKFYTFQRVTKDQEPILEQADSIYFTVKDKSLPERFLIQKTIDDMRFDSDGSYHFRLEPSDTTNLKFGEYEYDLEVIHDGITTTIAYGKLIIGKEVTFMSNEG